MIFTLGYKSFYGSLKPSVRVSVRYRTRVEKNFALLDTGSEVTIIPLRVARILGLRLSHIPDDQLVGGGGIFRAYRSEATIICHLGDQGEYRLSRFPIYVPEDESFKVTVLGRDSIFRHFIICFDEIKRRVTFQQISLSV